MQEVGGCAVPVLYYKMEFICDIKFMAHTDRIEVKKFLCSDDFKKGDMVVFKNNGLEFRVENNQHLKWMKQSGNYVKVIKEIV